MSLTFKPPVLPYTWSGTFGGNDRMIGTGKYKNTKEPDYSDRLEQKRLYVGTEYEKTLGDLIEDHDNQIEKILDYINKLSNNGVTMEKNIDRLLYKLDIVEKRLNDLRTIKHIPRGDMVSGNTKGIINNYYY
jgi:hypothetical protein